MANRRAAVTEKWINKRIKDGYGQGTGENYKPWLKVQDFSSLGRVHRIKGWKHGRVHHLFSDLERNIFLYYEWSPHVSDIREQFPLLPVEETVEIAAEIGVRHPIDSNTKHPIVLTTDFLLTVENGLKVTFCPRPVKYLEDMEKPRVREKLEIERRYWLSRQLNCKPVTEEHVSDSFVRNMLWVHPHYKLVDLYPLTELEVNRIAKLLTWLVLNEDLALHEVVRKCDRILKLEVGTGMAVVRHMMAKRFWVVNMNSRIRTRERLALLNTPMGQVYPARRHVA
jgi:hypothetical protein